MNTVEIDVALRSDVKTAQYFIGVFEADMLPMRVKYPFAFIVNTDTSSKSGVHWVAIFVDKFGNGEYFDSFGLRPWVNFHINFLNRNAKNWRYNNISLQNIYSSACGHYCCVYLALKARGFGLHELISKIMCKNTTKNDLKLMRLFKSFFPNRINMSESYGALKTCQHCIPKHA
jgi:hypothetical protein